jgi:hypothetical protein
MLARTDEQLEMVKNALYPLSVGQREDFLKLLHEQLKVRSIDLKDAIDRAMSATKHVGTQSH